MQWLMFYREVVDDHYTIIHLIAMFYLPNDFSDYCRKASQTQAVSVATCGVEDASER